MYDFLTEHWNPSLCVHNPPSGSNTQNPFQVWHGSHWHDPLGLAGSQRADGTGGKTFIISLIVVMMELFWSIWLLDPSLVATGSKNGVSFTFWVLPSSSGMPVVHPLRGQERLSCHSSGQWTWRMAGEVLPQLQLAQKTERPVRCGNSDKQTEKEIVEQQGYQSTARMRPCTSLTSVHLCCDVAWKIA